MNYSSHSSWGEVDYRACRAFTLIELLVVIGVIVIMLGGIGIALSGGNKGTGIQAAQGNVGSMLYLARAQAALNSSDAALAINADANDSDRYLKHCVVVVKKTNAATGVPYWEALDAGQYLPTGVYFLMPTVPTTNYLESGVDFSTVTSDAFNTATVTITNSEGVATANPWWIVGMTSLGYRVVGSAGDRIVLTVGNAQPPGSNVPFTYSNSQNARGFLISKYGVGTIINDFNGFKTN